VLAGPSSARGVALALLAALLGPACSRDAAVTPFRVALTTAGASIIPANPPAGIVTVTGTGSADPVVAPGLLRITGADGTVVEARFDARPGVDFPPSVNNPGLVLELLYDHTAVDADGGPLPVRALRVTVDQQPVFLLGEGTLVNGEGLAALSIPMQPESLDDDVPFFELLPAPTAFEPSRCGDQYYDLLRVRSLVTTAVEVLERGGQVRALYGPGPEAWTVRFVDGWHRTHLRCGGKARAWVQAAAWR
jgi:hypothetical protein